MGWWTGLGWATPGGGQALIRSHRPVEGLGGWGRQVIIRTASAIRQPVDRVRPHPDLKGLRLSAGPVLLLSLASGKQGGMHHCHTEWEPNRAGAISSTGVSPPDRVRAIQPTSSLPAGYALPRFRVDVGPFGPRRGRRLETTGRVLARSLLTSPQQEAA